MALRLIPLKLSEANSFVDELHRHHKKTVGHKFSIGAVKELTLVGVSIVGRPVSRYNDDGQTLEVTRLCTNGEKNACSFLYGASARAAFALGYDRIITYTLCSEPGTTLRAAGWKLSHKTPGRSWNVPSRPREDKHVLSERFCWIRSVRAAP